MILKKKKKILKLKNINISEMVLVNYIRNNHVSGFIGVEKINRMIQDCVSIDNNNNNNEIIEDSIINTNDVHPVEKEPQTIAESIVANIQSTVPKREIREELIYVKGISGINFTNTFNLNKTFNNVESIELMNGYVNDSRAADETNNWDALITFDGGNAITTLVSSSQSILTITTADTNGVVEVGDTVKQATSSATGNVSVILSSTTFRLTNIKSGSGGAWKIGDSVTFTRNTGMGVTTELKGSIGPIPFLWLDIVDPTIRNYSHYANYTINEKVGDNACGCGFSYCARCGISGQGFTDCRPEGTFLVSLKQINSIGIDTSGTTLPQNMVYIVDNGEYTKKFNQLISINKLKLNLKNINGRLLWGCDACSLGNTSLETSNLLRWEFIFKVKYYVNVLENKFLLQN